MKELYKHHIKEEYNQIKKIIFSFSVISDAIKVIHAAINEEIAGYLTKTYSGEYKNVSFCDTDEAVVISLWTRAKSALLNRKVVARKSLKTKVSSPENDAIEAFEKTLYNPEEDMKYDTD